MVGIGCPFGRAPAGTPSQSFARFCDSTPYTANSDNESSSEEYDVRPTDRWTALDHFGVRLLPRGTAARPGPRCTHRKKPW